MTGLAGRPISTLRIFKLGNFFLIILQAFSMALCVPEKCCIYHWTTNKHNQRWRQLIYSQPILFFKYSNIHFLPVIVLGWMSFPQTVTLKECLAIPQMAGSNKSMEKQYIYTSLLHLNECIQWTHQSCLCPKGIQIYISTLVLFLSSIHRV